MRKIPWHERFKHRRKLTVGEFYERILRQLRKRERRLIDELNHVRREIEMKS